MPSCLAVLFLGALFAAAVTDLIPHSVPLLYVAISTIAFLAYAFDKQAAKRNGMRIRERTLHAFALAGGWPGALVAQRAFRHKTVKQGFRLVLWATIMSNCAALAAFLYLRHAYLA